LQSLSLTMLKVKLKKLYILNLNIAQLEVLFGTVNAIAPGFFLTEQNRALLIDSEGNYTERSKKILSQTPMGRFGEKEELLGALLWLLCKEASGFVTGTVIPVDGGFSAYSGV
ncbi:MAG: SDR family oxidoreductase, partial [Clostridia bacterium]|nr:SDR family oxidoreductase [Clostridia bacterium]